MKRPRIRTAPEIPEPSRSTLDRMREIAAGLGVDLSPQDTHGRSFAERRGPLILSLRLSDRFTSAELLHRDNDGDEAVFLLERHGDTERWDLKRGADEDERWDQALPRRRELPKNQFVPIPDRNAWENLFADLCRAFVALANDL